MISKTKSKMNSKKWLKIFFSITICLILLVAILIITIDPFLHFHDPLSNISYYYDATIERYVNNGFIKHTKYNAIITGTSFTENFKVSEFNNLFNCNSIKVPLSAADLKELSDQLSIAINYNSDLKYVLLGFVYNDLFHNKDDTAPVYFPTYLYDDNPFNDYKYIFDWQALKRSVKNIAFTLEGNESTNFDDYACWNDDYTFSKEEVLSKYDRIQKKSEINNLSDEDKKTIIDNINQNLISIIESNNDITFYILIAPHSIAWWDSVSQDGNLLRYLQGEEILINLLIKHTNVKLYSFFTNFDLICNLDNYKDLTHFRGSINSQILNWIKNDEYLITEENINEYIETERNFYLNYDYESIFK